MAEKMTTRKRLVLDALRELGGKATTRAIAEKLGLNVNGVAQTLGSVYEQVIFLGGHGGDAEWKIK